MLIENVSNQVEGLLGSVFDTMSEGFSIQQIITDASGQLSDLKYIAVNPAFERASGLKAADIVGKTKLELFPGTHWLDDYINVARTGEPSHFEAVFGPLGRCFQVRAFKIDPGYLAVLFFDITDRKQAEEAVKAASKPQAKASLNCTVLLVEDHEDTRKIMVRLLTRMGCQVKPASTAAEALAIAQTERLDLVISDIGLPDMSGLGLMQQLKSRHKLRGIALSGFGMDEDLTLSKEAGFEVHLTKPINLQALEETVRRLVKS